MVEHVLARKPGQHILTGQCGLDSDVSIEGVRRVQIQVYRSAHCYNHAQRGFAEVQPGKMLGRVVGDLYDVDVLRIG
jgi:hypothetical protein